ncbi:hypothetical protein X929_03725 [Petrotoga olearia DSM 13574]|uniref:Uncharacterized protein n=1 Tax=Petrotoga olearia DSM 13574 TaxID=1122955 RepID=A0A2K1P2A9_9BACT|nr:hypothetical protein X929_03725 [Petrotoga olearia DSM 13574]
MFLNDFEFELDFGDFKGFTLLQPCAKRFIKTKI